MKIVNPENISYYDEKIKKYVDDLYNNIEFLSNEEIEKLIENNTTLKGDAN